MKNGKRLKLLPILLMLAAGLLLAGCGEELDAARIQQVGGGGAPVPAANPCVWDTDTWDNTTCTWDL